MVIFFSIYYLLFIYLLLIVYKEFCNVNPNSNPMFHEVKDRILVKTFHCNFLGTKYSKSKDKRILHKKRMGSGMRDIM